MSEFYKNPWVIGGGAAIGALILFGGRGGSSAPDYVGAGLQSQAIASQQDTQLGLANIQATGAARLAGIQAGENRDSMFSQLLQAKMMHQTDMTNAILGSQAHAQEVGAQVHATNMQFLQSVVGGKLYYQAQIQASKAAIQQAQIQAGVQNNAISANQQTSNNSSNNNLLGNIISGAVSLIGAFL